MEAALLLASGFNVVLKETIMKIKHIIRSPLTLPLIAPHLPSNIQSTSNPNDHMEGSPKLHPEDFTIPFQSYLARLSSTVLGLVVKTLPCIKRCDKRLTHKSQPDSKVNGGSSSVSVTGAAHIGAT
ncbi:hypothetical protein J3459_004846 [Metarhizium acridum]|uniref:uncharacterized protein n=1 Tax=Metarhizium acridum TaxID=92637 RepID=UPI001C6C2A72|nr:hypothetical protein J3458_004758 [Metarhizium acridum]KAG8428272.1 hypothetical protein J3459_004846 [Metarhizium acridum]